MADKCTEIQYYEQTNQNCGILTKSRNSVKPPECFDIVHIILNMLL